MQNVFQLHKLLQYWFKGIFWLYVNTINKLFKKSCKMNMALTSFKKTVASPKSGYSQGKTAQADQSNATEQYAAI